MEFNERFRGYLPVVIDLETGGFDAATNPLLELSCVLLNYQQAGQNAGALSIRAQHTWHIHPYPGSTIDPASLKVTGIDLKDPGRNAVNERDALMEFFKHVRTDMKTFGCTRAIIVAHNAHFDLGFMNAAIQRCAIKRNPFHPFSVIDTASLAAVAYGHTVLAQACVRAGLEFDDSQAHSSAYDSDRTARLFMQMVNRWELSTAPP